ncbi:MAG: translation elongation factor Ts [Deltaproteobacteria bacterium]|nr:MAG: translation elongation factor Ts [Deltaproteobacteria bacterium]
MSAADIKALRARTGAGILDCKKALAETGGDMEAAIDWLRAKGIAKAAKKASRAATEGLVEAYIHAGGRIGVLVEVNCETDFVALNENFRTLVKDIAMHIAAAAPSYVRREDIPPEAIEHEKRVQKARVIEEGKPEHIADRIVEGRMGKFYADVCLLEQVFVKDDKKTVQDILNDAIATIGENIQVRRFVRYELGEGLEKKSDDFAAEVAQMAAKA